MKVEGVWAQGQNGQRRTCGRGMTRRVAAVAFISREDREDSSALRWPHHFCSSSDWLYLLNVVVVP